MVRKTDKMAVNCVNELVGWMTDCMIVPTVAHIADCLVVPMALTTVGLMADKNSMRGSATRASLVAVR